MTAGQLAQVDRLGDDSIETIVGGRLRVRDPDRLGSDHQLHFPADLRRLVGGIANGPAARASHGQPAFGPLDDGSEEAGLADEVGDESVRRCAIEAFRRAHLLEPSVVHDGDPVGHGERLGLIVGDVDHRDPELALELLDLELHVLAQLLVERPEGLVHEEQTRLEHHRPGERHALLLAAAQLAGHPLSEPAELHQLQRPLGPLLGFPAGHLAHPQRVGDVLGDGHVGEERIALKDHPDVPQRRGQPGDVLAVEDDAPPVRHGEPGDGHQQGGLARAAGAEEGQELLAPHVDGDVVHRAHVAVVLRHVLEAQIGVVVAHGRPPSFLCRRPWT